MYGSMRLALLNEELCSSLMLHNEKLCSSLVLHELAEFAIEVFVFANRRGASAISQSHSLRVHVAL